MLWMLGQKKWIQSNNFCIQHCNLSLRKKFMLSYLQVKILISFKIVFMFKYKTQIYYILKSYFANVK